mmetsp:Transcript_7996/g.17831  ORF Transcript_7996/g.17831 Transcript_7996/m.17831 type:complete len:240 (-) Transcript_7996:56-775(-)
MASEQRRLFRLISQRQDDQVREELPQMLHDSELNLDCLGEGRWSNFTPLAMAVMYCPSLIQYLVTQGADINIRDGENLTLLHRAAYFGQLTSAKIVFDLAPHQISAEAPDFFRHVDGSGATPFDVAVRFRRTNVANWLCAQLAPAASRNNAVVLRPSRDRLQASRIMENIPAALSAVIFKDCQALPFACKSPCDRSAGSAAREIEPVSDEIDLSAENAQLMRLSKDSVTISCGSTQVCM